MVANASTYGEQQVAKLLGTLPPKQFWYKQEPTLIDGRQQLHPDFVVVAAALGVFVIEVKDWVEITDADHDLVTIKRRSDEVVNEPNPTVTARNYTLTLMRNFQRRHELLRIYNGKSKILFPCMSVVALPNIPSSVVRQVEQTGIWAQGEVWGREDLRQRSAAELLERVPRKWKMEQMLDTATLDLIRGVVDPHIVVINKTGEDIGTLTVRQEKLIKEPVENFAPERIMLPIDDLMDGEVVKLAQNARVRLVRGVAGSGKSLVLARRAQHLAEQYPDRRFLVLAFNKDLIADLQQRMTAQPNVEITNFHALCSRIFKSANARWPSSIIKAPDWLNACCKSALDELNLTSEYVAEEFEWRTETNLQDNEAYLTASREGRGQSLTRQKREQINTLYNQYRTHKGANRSVDWSDIPHETIKVFHETHPLAHTYDAVLVDEAQDFAPSWIQIILHLIKPEGMLFLCDDPTQSLFRAFSWKQRGVEVVGRSVILRVPFRSTREITEAAHSLIKADGLITSNQEDTPMQPDLTTYTLRSGTKPMVYYCRDAEQERQLIEQLAGAADVPPDQIAILCHGERIFGRFKHLKDRGYYVGTFKQMKGLEFRTVFVPQLNNAFDVAHSLNDDQVRSDTCKRVFTAMTRARDTLVMTCQMKLPVELDPMLPFVEQMNI